MPRRPMAPLPSPASSYTDVRLVDRLMRPAAFLHAVTELRLKETHISWIVLTGPYAYKIKKPVRYDFLDASSLERRRALCLEELRLNRRFAPDLYVDVVAISEENGEPVVGGHGMPLEFAVRMHEFEPTQELACLLAESRVTEHDAAELGAVVADMHRRAPVAEPGTAHGSFAAVQQQVLDNLPPLMSTVEGPEQSSVDRLAAWTRASLAALEPLIAQRRRSGAIRECHGDLHARNVVRWRQHWLPYDCVEFDPALRWIDVMSDLAFLFMDIAAHGGGDLASVCLSRYLEVTGDYEGLRLLPFYAVYRALVRAKIDALAAQVHDAAGARALRARLADRLAIADRLSEQRRPALVIMHGVTACGKSWLSERLVPTLQAVRVRSDLERKRLAGVPPLTRRTSGVGEGPYAEIPTVRTYERLRECAAHALAAGFNVVVDAAFLRTADRDTFAALACARQSDFLIVSCEADRATLDSRLVTRAQVNLDPSEADRAVLEHQLATREPLAAHEQAHAVRVDTNWLTSADAGVEVIRAKLRHTRFR